MEQSRPRRRKVDAAKRPKNKDPHTVNAELVTALNHPTRRRLLKLYLEADAPLSPKELADLTGEKLPTVSYHVRVLADKNAIELAEEEPVRGSVAHFYRPTALTKRTTWVRQSLDLESPKS
ncbi:MAG TPA: helix-turn-helix domain-containing protein [Solirubrobacterales bacterium]|nr:helix-turn-helix domain-containing protein [Solirubrobacterales bacterium]